MPWEFLATKVQEHEGLPDLFFVAIKMTSSWLCSVFSLNPLGHTTHVSMEKRSYLVIALGVFLLFSSSLFAQETPDTTQLWRIETKDGNNYVGILLEQDAENVYLREDMLGDIRIFKSRIVEMEPVRQERMVEGEYWFSGLHNSRYFFTPNGYGLEAGKGYYQNIMLFLNQVSLGLTDNFSLGLGTVPFLFSGEFALPIWLTPKASIPIKKDKWNIGAGGIFATILGEEAEWIGIAYGVSTWGGPDKNFTAGLGYGFAGGEWADTPAITISGMIRTGRRGYFITENYFLDVGDGLGLILSAGGRYGNKVTLDYGGIMIAGGGEFVVLPWVGVVVPFRGKRAKAGKAF